MISHNDLVKRIEDDEARQKLKAEKLVAESIEEAFDDEDIRFPHTFEVPVYNAYTRTAISDFLRKHGYTNIDVESGDNWIVTVDENRPLNRGGGVLA